MSRDRFVRIMDCPGCGQKGVFQLSDLDGPGYFRDQSVEVDEIEGDFAATGQSDGTLNVVCKKCQTKFKIVP